MKLEVFFDCSSPWTYLAFERLQPLASSFGVTIHWRPVLVGAIFNAVNPGVEFFNQARLMPERKLEYYLKDLRDWAQRTGITINFPPRGHPVNSVKAMRSCLVLEQEGKLVKFARAAFEAYFGQNRLISDDDVIRDICRVIDVNGDWLLRRIAEPRVKAALHDNVDEAIARGAFGSPTMFLDVDDMYFGVDRLPLLAEAMKERAACLMLPPR